MSGRASMYAFVVFCKLLDEGVIFGKELFLMTGRAAAIGKVRGENKDYPYGDTARDTEPSAVAPGQLPITQPLMNLTRRYRARFCVSVILQPTLEDGVTHKVDAAGDVELPHRVRFVDLDSLNAQGEAGCDFFVAVSKRNEAQDF